jgi:hypothetical protein
MIALHKEEKIPRIQNPFGIDGSVRDEKSDNCELMDWHPTRLGMKGARR